MSVGFAWQRCEVVLELGSYPQVHIMQKNPDSAENLSKQLSLGWRRCFESTLTLPVAAVFELRLNLLQHECKPRTTILPGK